MTTARLLAIRLSMARAGLSAYIVPTDDAHQSEYVAACYKRREYISQFSGSAGTAVITNDRAMLWTDGRYFLQAAQELDANWTLMRDRVPGAVPIQDWLADELPNGATVGFNSYLLSNKMVGEMRATLSPKNISLRGLDADLIDEVWSAERPPQPLAVAFPHDERYAGKSVAEKVAELQRAMGASGTSLQIVTALDEVAWLLNVRGSDIEYNPVVISYATVDVHGSVRWYIDRAKVPAAPWLDTLRSSGVDITVYDYDALLGDVRAWLAEHTGAVLVPADASFAIHSQVSDERKVAVASPIALLKACKNAAEIAGMRDAHVRDGAALVEFLCWLERQVASPDGVHLTEAWGELRAVQVSAAQRLRQFRAQSDAFVGLSFETISSVGANAAIIHYKPCASTAATLDRHHMYLVDSGAQYADGTTDVTRTVHLGEPTEHERRCWTHVLRAHIAVDTAVFPAGTTGYQLDAVARMPLWQAGLDYRHGTGHGVGAFLNVHEGPHGMSLLRLATNQVALRAGMTLSNEPGYYEDGSFGVRHENVLVVTAAAALENCAVHSEYLSFESLTVAPFQTKMIEPALLSPAEIAWVDAYHARCRRTLRPLLSDDARAWLDCATAPLKGGPAAARAGGSH